MDLKDWMQRNLWLMCLRHDHEERYHMLGMQMIGTENRGLAPLPRFATYSIISRPEKGLLYLDLRRR
jgi:hypothetical protein